VLTPTQEKLLGLMILLIMLGMGAGLTWKDFFLALRKPQGLLIGLFSQFGFMPMIAFGLAVLLALPPEAAIGLLIVGSVPGGTTSNLFTFFSKGNLALSVLMTVNSTLWAIVLTPAALYLWGSQFSSAEFQVPFAGIARTLAVLLVPVAIGMLVRRLSANVGAVLELAGGALGLLVIVFLIVTWVPTNWHILVSTPPRIFLAAITVGLIGFMAGYGLASALKLHPRNRRTIALETGIQNGPLAIGVVILTFEGPAKDLVLIVPALYSLFIVITSSVVTLYFRRVNQASEQLIPDLL
jgi:BASS family bile acid:Na+ symporter